MDHFETVRVTKDGRQIEVSVSISPVRDSTGTIVGASKIARDITFQKRAERELRAARDAAEAARKEAEAANRAKDHFLSVLSHELRTPLTPVLAAVSLLQESPDLPVEEVRRHVDMIRKNVETEARLVEDLLDVTRIARGKVQLHHEVVDAHSAIRNVVAMLQRETDAKRLEVALGLRAKDYHVWADPGRLQQVLLNLLSNAVKFTPEEGTVTVRTSNEDGGGRGLKIEVTDSGVGIEADVHFRTFVSSATLFQTRSTPALLSRVSVPSLNEISLPQPLASFWSAVSCPSALATSPARAETTVHGTRPRTAIMAKRVPQVWRIGRVTGLMKRMGSTLSSRRHELARSGVGPPKC